MVPEVAASLIKDGVVGVVAGNIIDSYPAWL
jgi:hypothetical protein